MNFSVGRVGAVLVVAKEQKGPRHAGLVDVRVRGICGAEVDKASSHVVFGKAVADDVF